MPVTDFESGKWYMETAKYVDSAVTNSFNFLVDKEQPQGKKRFWHMVRSTQQKFQNGLVIFLRQCDGL